MARLALMGVLLLSACQAEPQTVDGDALGKAVGAFQAACLEPPLDQPVVPAGFEPVRASLPTMVKEGVTWDGDDSPIPHDSFRQGPLLLQFAPVARGDVVFGRCTVSGRVTYPGALADRAAHCLGDPSLIRAPASGDNQSSVLWRYADGRQVVLLVDAQVDPARFVLQSIHPADG